VTSPKSFLAIAAVCAVLAGCSPNIQNKEAVKKGVLDYFQSNNSKIGLNLDQMAIDVVDVQFKDKEATAVVSIRAKASPTNDAAMQLKYQLEQKGDKWVVKGKTGVDAHAPAAPAAESPIPPLPNPDGTAPVPASPKQNPAALPPGHPPTGEAKKLPPNHPPVDPKKP